MDHRIFSLRGLGSFMQEIFIERLLCVCQHYVWTRHTWSLLIRSWQSIVRDVYTNNFNTIINSWLLSELHKWEQFILPRQGWGDVWFREVFLRKFYRLVGIWPTAMVVVVGGKLVGTHVSRDSTCMGPEIRKSRENFRRTKKFITEN